MSDGRLSKALRYLRRSFAPSSDEPSDRQLLARFAECRDHDAFAVLVQRHGPMVLAVCRRLLGDVTDAEDAFQATFVVLARKAGARGWQESIGSWLYEVAYRCASKVRTASARRRCQSQVPDMPHEETTSDVERHELRAALDDELSRMPEKYRAPLVLCYLEGKSNEEAARLLGCPVGTVYGRLARARDLLRDRLAKRRLMTTAAVLLAEDVAPAAVPAALLDATVQAAALSSELARPVTFIVEGVLHAMFVTKLKMAAVLLLTIGLIGAGAGVYHYQRDQGTVAAAANLAPLPETETKVVEDGKVRSKVVHANGVDFQAVADKVWIVPAANKGTRVDIALVISNSTDKEQTFLIWEMPRVHLATTDGKELRWRFARDGTRPVTRLVVAAGKTATVSRQAVLGQATDRKTLSLGGDDDSGGVWWFDGLQATKYVLTLSYENNLQSKGEWGGSVKTEPVEITVRTVVEKKADGQGAALQQWPVLGRGAWGQKKDLPQQRVIRSAAELLEVMGTPDKVKDEQTQREATAALAKGFGVKDIDWKKQMVVLVHGLDRPTPVDRVRFIGLLRQGQTLTAQWELIHTGRNGPAVVVKAPPHSLLVERIEGPIDFGPPSVIPVYERD